ncbi:hypothetical protein TNCV_30231 [Trichonephila clavipes]|nr:hypothetical protein TNCV_30231 [Trichonephila clavipes]
MSPKHSLNVIRHLNNSCYHRSSRHPPIIGGLIRSKGVLPGELTSTVHFTAQLGALTEKTHYLIRYQKSPALRSRSDIINTPLVLDRWNVLYERT